MRVAATGDLAALLHDAVEVGLEGAPVALALGLLPGRARLVGKPGKGALDFGRHVDEPRAVALEDAHLCRLHGREHGTCRREPLQQGARLGRAQQGVVLFLKYGQRLAAVGGGRLGVDGLAVAGYADAGVAVCKQVPLKLVEGGDVGLGVGEGSRRHRLGDEGQVRCGVWIGAEPGKRRLVHAHGDLR